MKLRGQPPPREKTTSSPDEVRRRGAPPRVDGGAASTTTGGGGAGAHPAPDASSAPIPSAVQAGLPQAPAAGSPGQPRTSPALARAAALAPLVGRGGAEPRRFAAIDMGSSSAKLLVVERTADGRERTLLDRKIGTALGKDLPADGALPEENQGRALAALRAFVEDAEALGVHARDVGLIATAAVRNAPNGEAFVARVRDEVGLSRARALSGVEEAEAGYLGAVAAVRGDDDGARFAALDLGGGSFQLSIGTARRMEDGGSTQIGSNKVLEELLPMVPITDEDFARADAALQQRAPMPLPKERTAGRALVATGGVSKFLRAHFGEDVVSRDRIDALRRQVGAMPPDERIALVQSGKDAATMKALGVETPQGARDYGVKLPASTTLLLRILDGLGVDSVRVSTTDARHAIIDAIAREHVQG